MISTRQKVALWVEAGVPARLVWEGRRFMVNDKPTRLGDTEAFAWHPETITHLPAPWVGWRFQAVDEAGVSLVFDVRFDESTHEWELLHVYD